MSHVKPNPAEAQVEEPQRFWRLLLPLRRLRRLWRPRFSLRIGVILVTLVACVLGAWRSTVRSLNNLPQQQDFVYDRTVVAPFVIGYTQPKLTDAADDVVYFRHYALHLGSWSTPIPWKRKVPAEGLPDQSKFDYLMLLIKQTVSSDSGEISFEVD